LRFARKPSIFPGYLFMASTGSSFFLPLACALAFAAAGMPRITTYRAPKDEPAAPPVAASVRPMKHQ